MRNKYLFRLSILTLGLMFLNISAAFAQDTREILSNFREENHKVEKQIAQKMDTIFVQSLGTGVHKHEKIHIDISEENIKYVISFYCDTTVKNVEMYEYDTNRLDQALKYGRDSKSFGYFRYNLDNKEEYVYVFFDGEGLLAKIEIVTKEKHITSYFSKQRSFLTVEVLNADKSKYIIYPESGKVFVQKGNLKVEDIIANERDGILSALIQLYQNNNFDNFPTKQFWIDLIKESGQKIKAPCEPDPVE